MPCRDRLKRCQMSAGSRSGGRSISTAIRVAGRRLLEKLPFLDALFRRFIWSRIHFPEAEMRLMNSLPRHSVDVAVDVGAAMGGYCWILGRISNEVWAFEPGPEHYSYLRRMLFLTNINLVRAAVGFESCERALYTPGDDVAARHSATLSVGNPIVQSAHTRVARVDQVSLDAYLGEALGAGRSVDVIKIDVEGYELEVIRGAMRILSQHYPLLICEIEVRHNANYGEVFSALRSVGYSCFFCRGGHYHELLGNDISPLQSEADLSVRLSPTYNPARNEYINNFVFQHPRSRVKVMK